MEESQKSKNMRSMCSFQQANNHRTRILKFYKTDLGSSQSIKNFQTHNWKMEKYEICTADFLFVLVYKNSVDNVISAHLMATISFTMGEKHKKKMSQKSQNTGFRFLAILPSRSFFFFSFNFLQEQMIQVFCTLGIR